MVTLRILGLDDDNHSPMWVCENGTVFGTAKEIMSFLAKPHDVQYEIKMFALTDNWSEELLQYEEDQVNDMFDILEGIARCPKDIDANEIFNMFWESANRNYW